MDIRCKTCKWNEQICFFLVLVLLSVKLQENHLTSLSLSFLMYKDEETALRGLPRPSGTLKFCGCYEFMLLNAHC